MPEPLEPSPVWLEAITKAEALPPAPYVVRVGLGDSDPDYSELARLAEPGLLVEGLQALSLRFPRAAGVEVYRKIGSHPNITLECLVAAGELPRKE